MKLKDLHDAEKDFSGIASDLVRKFGYTGIAIVWIFKMDDGGTTVIPPVLLSAMLLIVLGLLVDVAQYVFAAFVWGRLHRKKEQELKHDQTKEFLVSKWIVRCVDSFFYVKMFFIVPGFLMLVGYVACRSWHSFAE